MDTRGTIVVLSPGGGHAERLLPLVAGLTQRRLVVHVMTRPEARSRVEAAGGIFHDLFAKYSIEAVDHESIPMPSRLVTFAAAYAKPLTAEVAELRPRLLLYDSFMVCAPLVGRRLGIPYVGMRAGHAQVPAEAIAEIRRDPRVAISRACEAAVETLRDEYGMTDASPFSYLDGVSPHLNLYPEPAHFLDKSVRRVFEPMAFFGSLAPEMREARSKERPLAGNAARLGVYISFGTAIWRYYADVALGAMLVLSDVLSQYDADTVISLGNHAADAAVRRHIERPNVRVGTYVDQWGALKDADLFVTHHGLNSTHEAIFHRVPMLSYPFFGDQPLMAERCQDLGLAVGLSTTTRGPLHAATIHRQIELVRSGRETFKARLAEARTWELDTIQGREAVIDRLLALT